MRRWTAAGAALAVAVAVVLAVTAVAVSGPLGGIRRADSTQGRPVEALGPGEVTVELGIDHSRFSTDRLTVRAGTVVRFVVDNDDPINHELIVGSAEVHRRHETGTEAQHPPVAGEVSVPALETAETRFRFDDPGTVRFACHLPGHVAFGMEGVVEVIP